MVLPADAPPPDRHDDPPVAINAETPVEYPPALFDQGIEGNVILRLHTDEEGQVVPESTKVAESSGYPALDSAALLAAPQLRFAPAQHNGAAVAATFLQPVHFRHPPRAGTTP
jgi:protein TonB